MGLRDGTVLRNAAKLGTLDGGTGLRVDVAVVPFGVDAEGSSVVAAVATGSRLGIAEGYCGDSDRSFSRVGRSVVDVGIGDGSSVSVRLA